MWMHFDLKRSREGCGISLPSLVILCWCHISVNAVITDAAVPHINDNNAAVQEIFSSSDNTEKCNNMTSVTNSNGLAVVNHESVYPYPPTVPPSFLNGVIPCQPYRGIYVNHIYFQLANAFFLLSHLAPSGIHGVLYLRCTLLIGCAFLTIWGWTIVCWMDAAMWNGLFVIINFLYVCTLLYRLRPIKYSKEIEEVYVAVFQPLRVSRHQFKKILSCMKTIRQLKYQEVYAQEKVTKVDSLSLVLSGKLVVSQNGKALHIIFPHQFLDSPEWFGVSTDEYFQVSITAMEESRILLWHRDKLKLSIMSDQFLQAVFDHILGRDVVRKLMQVSETMAAGVHQNQNGQIVGFSGLGNIENEPETKMFVVKKSNDHHGITALISRQLQEEGVPLLYTRTDVLNNALHHLNHLHAPYMLPLHNDPRTKVHSSSSES